MEPNQPDPPLPDKIDDTTYYFIQHHNDQGVGMRRQGDLDKAIAYYNSVLAIRTDVAVVYNNRGIAWLQKGDVDRAIADFNQAIEIAAEFAAPYYNLGIA